MRNLLLFLILLNLFSGCKPASEPVGSQPTQAGLFGKWVLDNSPTMSRSLPVSTPTKGNSSILLTSNHVAKLTNVLIEEMSLPAGAQTYRYKTTLKTEEDVWDIQKSQGFWSVEINLPTQVIALHIKQKADGEFELCYQPDPEREPFIYIRDAKANSK